MVSAPLPRLGRLVRRALAAARGRVAAWSRPAPLAVAVAAAVDATRSRPELLLGNALLRHQLAILRRTCPGRVVHPSGCTGSSDASMPGSDCA